MKSIPLLFLSFALLNVSLYSSAPGTGKTAAENGAPKVSLLRAQRAALIIAKPHIAPCVGVNGAAEVVHKIQDHKNAVGAKKEKNKIKAFPPERLACAVLLSDVEKNILGIQDPLLSEVLGKVTVGSRPATGGAPEVDSVKFNQIGYFINSAQKHKRGSVVAAMQDKQYKLGVILGASDEALYHVQFEQGKIAKISALHIAIRPVQK